MEELEVIHAERKAVKLMGCLEVESYLLPDGEIRIDLSSTSVALGYSGNWLTKLINRKGKAYRALTGKGFKGEKREVKITRSGKGSTIAYTITFDDFQTVVEYTAKENNPIAIAYLSASSRRSGMDDLREAWGQERLSIEERRQLYCQELAKAFTDSEWAETSGAGQVFDWEKAKDPEWLLAMFSTDWQPSMLLQGIDMDQYAEEWYTREDKEEFEEV